MRLKRLELYGYKSFASRATFEFSDGITAIVGPNGSGKSNIADGVRWVLGEQSYSNLRGRRTEDMIFAGSRRRSRLGMAEVSLTLDNSDRWLDIDFTEVTIGRRAFRSGENEYLLNGTRVRYREISDLLGAAGLAASNYVVIGQGLVDAALALTPEARRSLFEEAAGIAPQLRKREETIQRIQETRRNLERAEDIINELRPRARTLRRQAERAEEHMLLVQDLRELQRIWYGYQWQNLQVRVAQAEALLASAREHLDAQRGYARELQGRQDALREQIAQQISLQGTLTDRLDALRDESGRLSRDLAVSAERARLYAQQIESAEADQNALLSRRTILAEEVARASTELSDHERRHRNCLSEIEELRSQVATTDKARAQIDRELHTLERRLAERDRELAQRQAQSDQLAERKGDLETECKSLGERSAQITGRLDAMRGQTSTLEAREAELDSALSVLEELQQQAEDGLLAAREELVALEQRASEARSERDRLLGRQRALQRVREQMSEYHPGVREILRASDRLSGIRGTVANLMRVPQEYEQAIQSALGSRLENIVTDRWEDAEAAIALLKQRQAGWATFLPLDTLQVRPALQARTLAGVVGVASELVRYDDSLRPVYELLLGHVLVTQDLAAARRLLRERTGATLLVTLEGETVQPSGAVSGGARQAQTQLLAQEREWRAYPALVQAAEDQLGECLAAVAAVQEQSSELQTGLRQRAKEIAHARRERELAHQSRQKHGDEVARIERDATWITSRMAQIESDSKQLAERQQVIVSAVGTLNDQGKELGTRLGELNRQREALQDSASRLKLNSLETEAEVSARTARSVASLMESHTRNLEQVDQQIASRQDQRDEQARMLEQLNAQLGRDQERLDALKARLLETRAQLEPIQVRRAELEHEEESTARQHDDSLERLHEAETEYNQAVLERDRSRDRQTSLSTEIEESLGPIDLPEVLAHQLRLNLDDNVVELPRVLVLPAGLGDEIRQMRARLRRVGSINPEAPREYERLLERQTFLQTQVSDLRGAIASLQEVIEELDQVIEQDFGATVERVDKGFAVYFSELFRGGTARLVLTDPANMATTGVDIIAHPPGKHAQRLSLLSGGERALTAVALLFALLGANPVPFCFLDEVDAALDESNVGRFRDVLRSQSGNTQFVVITHNRQTIDTAATIYGISMEDQGVSQSISLQVSPSGPTA
jgi:chromosome segregation protein